MSHLLKYINNGTERIFFFHFIEQFHLTLMNFSEML